MNGFNHLFPRRLWATALLFFAALSQMQAQYTPCATPYPTAAQMAEVDEAMSRAAPPSAPLTWEIPVRVTVFRRDDGSGWNITYDDAFIDAFLSNMNGKVAGGPNAFHFFRCGPINYIDVDQLYSGSLTLSDYSYNRNYLNLYIYNKPGQAASATFPWFPEPKAVYMPWGIPSTSDATGFHELGHTLGLFHTFSPEKVYQVPVMLGQEDHPEQQGGRELVIQSFTQGKDFPNPNGSFAGDRVADTPPGCNDFPAQASFYPSSATIAGCWDNDPNTPCANGCLDGNPNTPCVNGCSWDYANCTYTGDYRDYNFDLIVDNMNVLARNIMSYTGACRQNFTPGQVGRADQVANIFLNDYYQEQLCGNLIERVEIEGTSTGLKRVNLRISPTADPADYSQTIVNSMGDFSGKLPISNISVQVKADLRRFRATDVTKYDNNWLSGLSTFDLLCIQKHILGLDTLENGYKMLAADANKSNSITSFDIVLFRKLILGIDTALAAYTQPWRFIPEVVTQQATGGSLQEDFDGIGFDTPFTTTAPAMGAQTITPTQYCEPTWPFLMKAATVRNGFDAVKLGNLCGPVLPDGLAGDCPGDVALLVPSVPVLKDDIIELTVKGFKFQSVAAFQTGIKATKEDFQLVGKSSGSIGDFATTEAAPGDLNQVQGGVKAVWMASSLAPQTVADGGGLFQFTLKANKDIADLSEAIELDESLLETFLLTADGGCVSAASLEISANNLGGGERSSGQGADIGPAAQKKIFCLPNPASDRLTVLFDAEGDFEGQVLVHDIQGRLLQTVPVAFSKGRNVVGLHDFGRLPNGLLNISVFDGKSVHSARVDKQ
jgi:hypothetical protein